MGRFVGSMLSKAVGGTLLWTECLCPFNIHMLKLNEQGDGFGKTWELIRSWGKALMNGISVLMKKTPKSSFILIPSAK